MSALATKAVLSALSQHLLEKMPLLEKVLLQFPEANDELQYPCISLTIPGDMTLRSQFPEQFAQGDTAEHKAAVKYDVGDYSCDIQADLWCGSKQERHELYEELFRAFSAQLPIMGLTLPLTEYHGVLARYDLSVLSFPNDDESASQRKEWRGIVRILAQFQAIREQDEFIITQEPVLQSDVRDDIIVE